MRVNGFQRRNQRQELNSKLVQNIRFFLNTLHCRDISGNWPCTPIHCTHRTKKNKTQIFEYLDFRLNTATFVLNQLLFSVQTLPDEASKQIKLRFPIQSLAFLFLCLKPDKDTMYFLSLVSNGVASELTPVSSCFHATALRLLGRETVASVVLRFRVASGCSFTHASSQLSVTNRQKPCGRSSVKTINQDHLMAENVTSLV